MRKAKYVGSIVWVSGSLLVVLTANALLWAWPGGGAFPIQDPVPPPIQNSAMDNFLRAETVVIGKVKSIEADPVVAAASPQDTFKSVYRIAAIEVAETLLGPKDRKTVRVGFRPVHKPQFKHLELVADQEGCFFLWKHHEERFYIPHPNPVGMFFGGYAPPNQIVNKKSNPAFEKDIALLKRCGKLLDDPMTGLRSKKAEDRLLIAALLITRYRLPPAQPMMVFGAPVPKPPKVEAIDAEESRLILETLAKSDLIHTDPNLRVSPLGLFYRLGLTPADGWKRPENVFEIPDTVRKWLNDHAATYRIQRIVLSEKTARRD